jgi:hypothetical protein
MTFAVVSTLGIVLQVDAAGVGPDQKADAPPSDPATLATIKTAIALARKGELAQASDAKESMSDPIARNVVEWAILRSKEVDFQRYVAFISENPSWPNIGLLRRRAEAALWKERLDSQTVRAYFDKDQPRTAYGKFALARALQGGQAWRPAIPPTHEVRAGAQSQDRQGNGTVRTAGADRPR